MKHINKVEMTRLEKCEYLKSKGYTYDPETGKIFGVMGKEIKRKNYYGYISISYPKIYKGDLLGHHFSWYMTYNNVDFDILDHINQIKNDNRICNLRIISNQKNTWNSKSKGYSWDKRNNKWLSRITFNGKDICLGRYKTEEDARKAYLNAKKIYHIIN